MITRAVLVFVTASIAPLFGVEYVENAGQIAPEYRFSAASWNVRLLARDNGDLVLRSHARGAVTLAWLGATPGAWKPGPSTGHTVRYCTAGLPRAACEVGGKTFASVRRANLYGGVDLILRSDGERLEYDLEVHPGVAVENIRFELRGDGLPSLDADGRILAGGIVQWRPVAYQSVNGARRPVDCAVRRLSARVFSFAVTGPYRPDLPLVIDPVIESAQVVTGNESSEDRVFGQAAGYVFGASKRFGGDNWDVFVSYNGVTTYWGGEGDEQVLGFDGGQNGATLTLVGFTASRDVYKTGALGRDTAYRGGASDGFLLEFSAGQIMQAALIGGPGDDKLNDVRRAETSGYWGPYLFAGETSDPNWTAFTVNGTPGGGADAVVGWFGSPNDSITVAGGSGADSARSIRAIPGAPGAWIVAGETESTDFAGKSAPGRDAWLARLSATSLRLDGFRSWGGSGEDRLAGLAVVPGHGVMLAGSTSSLDLPAAAGSQFNGGSSDGFVAWLDPVNFAPIQARYLGGPGTDEILSLVAWSNDLFLTGFTDSPSLSISGLIPGSDPAGRQDGLFVHMDSLLNPIVAYRAGGSGDDRFIAAEPLAWGRVNLAGWSESRPWLASLDRFAPPGDNGAAFSITLRYAVVAASAIGTPYAPLPPPIPTIGRDLTVYLSVTAYNEPASDGILIVRSTDPEKLRIAGEESALLFRAGEQNVTSSIALEALADDGEVDVVISGRTPSPGPVQYPERRIRVRLAPSRVFLQSKPGGVLDASAGSDYDVSVSFAPLLPNGQPAASQIVRSGLPVDVSLISSDPDVVMPVPGSYRESSGDFRLRVKALRPGTAALTVQSTGIPAAQGQQLPVRVSPPSIAQPEYPWTRPLAIMLDHSSPIDLYLVPGDRLQFTSEDPAAVLFGWEAGAPASTSVLAAGGSTRLWVSVLRLGAPAGIRVEGVLQGKTVKERIEILPLPYSIEVPSDYGRALLPGDVTTMALEMKPQGTLPAGVKLAPQTILVPSPLWSIRAGFSDPNVAVLETRWTEGSRVVYRFKAVQPGRATLEFDIKGRTFRMSIEVRPPALSFGPELRLPALAKTPISPVSLQMSLESQQRIRLRVSDPQQFGLEFGGTKGSDMTVDLASRTYLPVIDAKGPPGTTGSLFVSAQGIPEFEVPIRVIERVFLPLSGNLRLRWEPGEAQLRSSLSYRIAAVDSSASALSGDRIVRYWNAAIAPVKLRVTAEPAGICEFPAEVESGQFSLDFSFVCRREGRVKVDINGPDLSPEQSKFSAWVTVVRAPKPLYFEGVKVSVASGTQTEWYLNSSPNRQSFSGTLVSGDPARVKLSTSSTRLGGDRVTGSNIFLVYVQAFAGEGVVWIEARFDDGSREQIPVFLYPATMAVRSDLSSVGAQVRMPADQAKLSAVALPFAFEPGSGLVIGNAGSAFGSALSLTAGQDPFFLKTASSDSSVAEPILPNPLFSETDRQRPVNFKINGKGRAVLSVEQPPGFYLARNSGLTLEVVERELNLSVSAAAPGLQSLGYLTVSGSYNLAPSVPITLTSLDPSKLLLSASLSTPGGPVLSLSPGAGTRLYVQVLNTARPGDRLRVRVTAPGFSETISEILISSAELQWSSDAPRAIFPGNPTSASLRFGPIDPLNNGRVNQSWSGGLLPGDSVRLKLRAADSSILALAKTEIELGENGFALVPLQGLRPGETDLFVTAPEGIVNRAERTPVRVSLWEFYGSSSSTGVRGLWNAFTFTNPRSEPTTFTIRSTGATPVGLATAVTAPPSMTPLSLTVPPRGQGTFYWTTLSPGNSARLLITAPDFVNRESSLSVSEPQVAFPATSPLQLAVANRTATLTLQLQSYSPLPLAAAPLPVDVRSSDPSVLRVVSNPVQFKTGQVTATFNVEMLSPGTAVLTATLPADFADPRQVAPATLTVVTR